MSFLLRYALLLGLLLAPSMIGAQALDPIGFPDPSNTVCELMTFDTIAGTLNFVGDGATGQICIAPTGVSLFTLSATGLLDLSGTDSSTTTEGLLLPQIASACVAATAEGQICWDTANEDLYVGNGSAAVQMNAGGGEVNDLEAIDPPTILDTEVYIGTGAGTGEFAPISGDATVDNTGALTIAANAVALTTDTTGNYADGDAEAGSALTALALAANGANCAAGEIALGVDDSGAVEGCYEPVEADIADLLSGVTDFNFVYDNADAHGGVTQMTYDGTNITIVPTHGDDIAAEELVAEVWNDSGATIFKCAPVYASGFSIPNDLETVGVADADDAAKMPAIGLVRSDIANGAAGFIVDAGDLLMADTMTGEGWSVGDAVYVNASGTSTSDDCGDALTNVKPTGEAFLIQKIGLVARVNPSNGELHVTGAGRSNDLPNLDSGAIFVGSAGNAAAAVDVSGDATLASNGALTVVDDSHSHVITNIDVFTVAELQTQTSDVTTFYTEDTVVPVADGGTGASTLTDGGILLGSGTSALTALGVATNGQIPIGDGATDPVLATITGDDGITITNGAGSIEVDVTPLASGGDGDSSTTQADSGLEIVANELTLIRGCADNEILKWDETDDDWNCEADGGGGGTLAIKEFGWPAAALQALEHAAENIPPVVKDEGTNTDLLVLAFDDTTAECRGGTLLVPSDVDTSGTATFRVSGYAATGAASGTVFSFNHKGVGNNESWDQALTEVLSGTITQNLTQDQVEIGSWTATLSTLAWTASETVVFEFCREPGEAGDVLTGDYHLIHFSIEVPRA